MVLTYKYPNQRAYHERNKENPVYRAKLKETGRKYRNTHKEITKATRIGYDLSLRGRFQKLKDNGRKRNLEVSISLEEWTALVSLSCFYCGGNLPPKGTGIDRIDNKIGYILGNCRPCCTVCNLAKRALTEIEFHSWISKVFKHWIKV